MTNFQYDGLVILAIAVGLALAGLICLLFFSLKAGSGRKFFIFICMIMLMFLALAVIGG
ncbi:hypothetical protein ACKLKD_13150 [Klebsiella sp. 10982]|uniref:Uncharacterized protein n=1 Tax=Klebsiella quasivariicola TaxID=2026240 RepID=A0A8B4TYU3_9ENTR|nr:MULTISPECIES: hypothetical protein [Klebsiella]MBF7821504.1 hypothetical protein [Klebsiella quasivariicola]MBS5210372.1 hypothetical protein [Klebsiella sp.]MBZ9583041.1 hypothetical protein [Klebsiella quasivariicola]MCJ1828747.1 hypothetical protein [Klebsiella quasivariicola]MCL7686433.1 hypothetical protein [Klebsiella quasivariicola]